MRKDQFNAWVLIRASKSMPDVWTAECLTLGIVSQGDSPCDALDCLREAIDIAVIDDVAEGRDPLDRPKAREEHWDALFKVQQCGMPILYNEPTFLSPFARKSTIALQLTVRVPAKGALDEHPGTSQVPLFWVERREAPKRRSAAR